MIDFATPLDYIEPEKKHVPIKAEDKLVSNEPFSGKVT